MKTLLVDAYDSFIYIVRQYFLALDADPVVVRSNELTPAQIVELAPDVVVLGPGPGHPADSGHVRLVHELCDRIPLLGICLGHQAIGVAFGARVSPAAHIMHGKTSRIRHDGAGMFAAAGTDFVATRYHSLIVEEDTVPDCLAVTAHSLDDGYVMGLRHRTLPIESIQFHPESICTENGLELFRSFLHRHATPSYAPGRVRQ